ncbi:DNA relaxase mbeA [Klebsiella pneumoniae]|nr:DNA relaxase mbeA [Klebsiella pneumoniae]
MRCWKKGGMMIVKFHPRGRGGGAGPVDYLLGKDRQREGATVLQGKPEEVRELIDASPYAKKYTSGVLSFAEAELPPGQREQIMASFERVLMPGLDKDQYSILWVEHTDKGRLELNFLIPNTELLTGKRLQPYYDRADRPRIDAWQTVVNGRLGLHDPNAPENRRLLVTPSALPETKLEAAQAITRGLLALASSGELKTREDVTGALTAAGFEVVRTTKNSISIADPDGGRNIRLKGAIYEQSFNAGEGLGAAIESDAISAHEQGMTAAMQSNRLSVLRMVGRTWLTITLVSVLLIATSGSILWWQGQQITGNYQTIRAQERTQAMLSEKNHGVQLSLCGEKKLSCVKVNPKAGAYGEEGN